MYSTKLEQWKLDLSSELGRKVTYEEMADEAGVAYSTLQKHVSHTFKRPDFSTAAKICNFFNKLSSEPKRTPLDYFIEAETESSDDDQGQVVGVLAVASS